MKLSTKGRTLLKSFESFRADAYIPVPGDKVTIGYGFTEGVTMGQHMTKAQADARLVTELRPYEQAVLAACTMEPNQNQFDALCCLCFNIGIDGFRKSTVLKAHNRGDFQSAARAFGLWNKSSGVVYAGLTRRRAAESALYLEPAPGIVQRLVEGAIPSAQAGEVPPPAQAMPQQIDPESSMAGSAINRAATVAGTTAATVGAVSQIKSSMDELQGWIVPLLCVIVVALAGYIVWQRVSQRRKGWA